MKLLLSFLGISALGMASASAFTVITGSVVEFDSPDDLLLDPGTAVIAVNTFGNDASLTVNGVNFQSAGLVAGTEVVTNGGVTVTTASDNQIDNWAPAPLFTGGTPGSAGNLGNVMRDIRWANSGAGTNITVDVAGLNPGSIYNVQLLFNEGAVGRDRRWDIGVGGALAVDDFSSYGGNGAWTANNSFAYSGNFSATAAGELNIILGADPLPGDPNNTPAAGLDMNPILQGVVIHEIPEPGTGAMLGLAALSLLARRRRRS